MRFSEETLMAYADGELDAETRAAVEAAMTHDADLADAVAIQIENREALQKKLRAAFDGALTETVPSRLRDALQAPAATVTNLAEARNAQQAKTARWSLPHWGAIAASLLIGVLIGRGVFERNEGPFHVEKGRMTAQDALAWALSAQSGGVVNRETGIQLGVSYIAKSGSYCRTFTLRDEHALAGLACRRNNEWAIDALTPTRVDASGAYRMAGASVPAVILGIVEDTIAGDPLDPAQEAEARERNWQR